MARLNLNKLAKEMAPAFNKTSWGDVEDDVTLCVWVRKEAGEELTVKQAGKLREKMDAVIDTFPKVVVYVQGGVVQSCTSNNKHLRVFVVDRDNIEEEEDKEKAEKEALEGTDDCVYDVY